MMWLEAAAGLIVAALAAVRWLGSHMRLVWRYGPARRAAVTATATVIRELPVSRPLVIEPPVYGTTSVQPAHDERGHQRRPPS